MLLEIYFCQVSIADINEENGRNILSDLSQKYSKDSVIYVKCDVTDEGSLRHVFSETMATFGRLDILCNNAGIGDEKNPMKMIQINYVRQSTTQIYISCFIVQTFLNLWAQSYLSNDTC